MILKALSSLRRQFHIFNDLEHYERLNPYAYVPRSHWLRRNEIKTLVMVPNVKAESKHPQWSLPLRQKDEKTNENDRVSEHATLSQHWKYPTLLWGYMTDRIWIWLVMVNKQVLNFLGIIKHLANRLWYNMLWPMSINTEFKTSRYTWWIISDDY